MKKRLEKLCDGIDTLNEQVGRYTAWLISAMAAITFLVVVMRYGLNFGRIFLQESITYLHAFIFTIAAAYTLKHNEHVRVDIFYQHMTPRDKNKVDFFGTLLLLLPFAAFIAWISLDYVATSWRLLEHSREAGGLPFVYTLKTCIPAMAILLFLQAISMCGRAWLALRN